MFKKLLNPGYRLYSSSIMDISDKELPFYYLFPNAKINFRNKPYTISSVKRQVFELRDAQNRIITVHKDDHSLSIPEDFFSDNYAKWLSNISIGEEVDFFINNDSYHDWYRGIVEDVQFDGSEVRSMTISTSINNSSYPDYYQTVHAFSCRSLNRPFTRATTPSPGLQPFRFVFERNSLISNTNHGLKYSNGNTVYNENGMTYPSLYITVVNKITIENLWHRVSTAMDV